MPRTRTINRSAKLLFQKAVASGPRAASAMRCPVFARQMHMACKAIFLAVFLLAFLAAYLVLFVSSPKP